MIDDDVKQQCFWRDDNFDLGTAYVCAHNLNNVTSTVDNKVHNATHFILSSFTSFSPLGRKPGFTYPITQHTHTAGKYTISELQRHPAV